MNVNYSKQFIKASKKLSGKYMESLRLLIIEVKKANDISELTNCKKLSGLANSYRIRLGDYRLVFILKIVNNIAMFELLLSRGEIYKKEHELNLRRKEKDFNNEDL